MLRDACHGDFPSLHAGQRRGRCSWLPLAVAWRSIYVYNFGSRGHIGCAKIARRLAKHAWPLACIVSLIPMCDDTQCNAKTSSLHHNLPTARRLTVWAGYGVRSCVAGAYQPHLKSISKTLPKIRAKTHASPKPLNPNP